MKLILAIACMLLSTLSYGQCKYATDRMDPITKERIFATRTKGKNDFWIVNRGGKYHLEFRVIFGTTTSMNDGADITFLFTDDSTLTLSQYEFAQTETQDFINYTLNCYADMTPEDVQVLASKTVKLVRIRTQSFDWDVKQTPKMAEALSTAARCVIQ